MGKQIITQVKPGQVFNDWTVIEDLGRKSTGNRIALFRCKCGDEKVIQYASVQHGASKRCAECSGNHRSKHKKALSREYKIWIGIKSRTKNKSHAAYRHYGARGIVMCKDWEDFEVFYRDMGDCPAGYSIERVDNEKGYSPDNCIWASYETQLRNTRKSAVWVVNGVEYPSSRAAAEKTGISRDKIRKMCKGHTTKTGIVRPAYKNCFFRRKYESKHE